MSSRRVRVPTFRGVASTRNSGRNPFARRSGGGGMGRSIALPSAAVYSTGRRAGFVPSNWYSETCPPSTAAQKTCRPSPSRASVARLSLSQISSDHADPSKTL